MELILTEWQGFNQKVSLRQILDNQYSRLQRDIDNSVSDNIKKYKKGGFKKVISEINKHYPEVFFKNQDFTIENYSDFLISYIATLKESNYNFIAEQVNYQKIIEFVNNINQRHRQKNTENPIIEIYKINNDIFINTFQYVCEFQINLSQNKTLKIQIKQRDLINDKCFESMLSYIFNIKSLGKVTGEKSHNKYLLLYYKAFIERLKSVLSQGVYREYIDKEDNLNFLKEQLLIPSHVRLNYFNKSKVYCGFSELSEDNIINQTINYTIQLILKKVTTFFPVLISDIKYIQNRYFSENVLNKHINLSDIENIKFNKRNEFYKEIIEYCKNIIRNLGSSFSENEESNYTAFYLDMNELFEKYVGKKLQQSILKIEHPDIVEVLNKAEIVLGDYYKVDLQNSNHFVDLNTNIFRIKPDIVIRNETNTLMVADTKYKRLIADRSKNYNISSNDIYQILTYAKIVGTKKAMLIYPKSIATEYFSKPFKTFDDIEIFIHQIDLKMEKE